jgi:hypothetical protein
MPNDLIHCNAVLFVKYAPIVYILALALRLSAYKLSTVGQTGINAWGENAFYFEPVTGFGVR